MIRHHIPIRCAAAALAATLILASAAPPAEAVSEVAGATFPEQVVQEVMAVEQDEQAVLQTEQQISMRVSLQDCWDISRARLKDQNADPTAVALRHGHVVAIKLSHSERRSRTQVGDHEVSA